MTETKTNQKPQDSDGPKKIKPGKKMHGALIFSGIMTICFFSSIYLFRKEVVNFPEVVVRPFSDLYYILMFSLLNLCFRPMFNYVFGEKIAAMIKKQNLPDEANKLKKNLKQGKDVIIYTCTFVRTQFLGSFRILIFFSSTDYML